MIPLIEREELLPIKVGLKTKKRLLMNLQRLAESIPGAIAINSFYICGI